MILLLAMTPIMNAQVFVGGDFGINSSKLKAESGSLSFDDSKTFAVYINPKVGFFLSDNFAVGLGFGIGSNKYTEFDTNDDETVTKNTSWDIDPFARYYFKKVGDFSFFGEGTISIGGGKQVTDYPGSISNEEFKSMYFGASVSPAISYSLTEKIELEALIGSIYFLNNTNTFPNTETDDEYKEISSGFGVNLSLSDIYFGIIFKL